MDIDVVCFEPRYHQPTVMSTGSMLQAQKNWRCTKAAVGYGFNSMRRTPELDAWGFRNNALTSLVVHGCHQYVRCWIQIPARPDRQMSKSTRPRAGWTVVMARLSWQVSGIKELPNKERTEPQHHCSGCLEACNAPWRWDLWIHYCDDRSRRPFCQSPWTGGCTKLYITPRGRTSPGRGQVTGVRMCLKAAYWSAAGLPLKRKVAERSPVAQLG
jgi:hypothetical protein